MSGTISSIRSSPSVYTSLFVYVLPCVSPSLYMSLPVHPSLYTFLLCTFLPIYVFPCVRPSLCKFFPVYGPSLYTSLPVCVLPCVCSSLCTSAPVYVPLCVHPSLLSFSLYTSLPVYVFPYISLFLYTSLPLYIFSVFISFCIFVLSPCVHLLRVYILLYFCSISLCTSAPRLCPSICLFLYVCVFLCVCLTGCTFCREYIFVGVFPTMCALHILPYTSTVCTFHFVVYTLHWVYIQLCVLRRVYTLLLHHTFETWY